MEFHITALFTGLLILFYISLALKVVKQRRKNKTGIGSGGHDSLERAIRVHANFGENVPFALLILLLLELNGFPHWLLYAFGGILIVARVLHAHGLGRSSTISFGRYYGTLVTWLLLLIGSLILIAHSTIL